MHAAADSPILHLIHTMPILTAAPPTRRPRPWCIPPVSRRRPNEFVRGKEVLTEISGPVGVLLWLLHRDVELWAACPAERRVKLFRMAGIEEFSGLSLPEPIRREVPVVVDLLAGLTTLESGAAACSKIAAWARACAPHTGLLFAEAAAALSRSSARHAVDVGVHAANCGLQAAAESWFRHALAIARQTSDWTSAADAAAELGELALSRNLVLDAARWYARARRMVRRYSLSRTLRMRTARGLLRVTLRRGAFEHAQVHLTDAEKTYKSYTPSAPAARIALADDLITAGAYHMALSLLDGPILACADAAETATLAGLREHATAGAERDQLMHGRRGPAETTDHPRTPARP